MAPIEGSLVLVAARRLRRDPLGQTERKRVVAGLFFEGVRRVPFLHRFYSLMVLSVLIAVLGVLADSTAVVIGAMLVAPLMAPVLGVSAALVMDWPRRAFNSGKTACGGVVVGVALAFLVSWLIPGDPRPLPGELLSRTAPSMVDLGVALVAGAAGAYSQVRKQAADAIVGVAVAVALIPPLAVVGITLELHEWEMAAGAFLLFTANVVGIITAGALTFILFGLVPNGRLFETRRPIARSIRMTALATVLLVAPLQIVTEWKPTPLIDSQPAQEQILTAVTSWRSDVSVISVAIDELVEDGSMPTVHLTVATPPGEEQEDLGVDLLAEEIASSFGTMVNVVVTSVEAHVETATDDGEAEG